MSAFYPENRPLASYVLSVRRRRDYHYNDIVMAHFRTSQCAKMAQNPMVGSAKKGIESTRSMTTTAAKGANNPQK